MQYYNTNINVRINKSELEFIRNYAKSFGKTPGALMRELALESARRSATAGDGLGFASASPDVK
jgi:hypothetical protein